MKLPRVTALLLATALLRLNVARADVACASHESTTQPVPMAVSHHAAGHDAHGSEAPRTERESCDTPVQGDCCQALVSCSTVLGLDDCLLIAERSLHAAVTSATTEIPRSLAAAPDPPPPRV